MTERTLNRILLGVGVLVFAYLGAALLGGSPDGTAGDTNGPTDLLEAVSADRVESVRFAAPADTVRLERSDGGWTVNGRPADSATVRGFWSELEDARPEGPVARNPENHERMGVTDDGAVHVLFRLEGGEERELLVGSSGPAYPSAYVRIPDEDVVHLLHGEIRGAVERDADGWRDRTVARVDTSRVRRLEIDREGETYVVERDGSGWTVDGEPADSAAVRRLVGGLASIRASGFPPDTATLEAPSHRLVVTDAAGDTLLSLALLREEDAFRARARTAAGPTLYEVSGSLVDRLAPDPAGLRGSSDATG